MQNNLPNVPVLDLTVQPREHDLIVGAFGRGVFVTNIAALEEINDDVLAKEVYLFGIKNPTVQRLTRAFGANDWLFGQGYLLTPNPESGMAIQYYLRNGRSDRATIVITDATGKEVARLKGETVAGINTVVWNMLEPHPQSGGGESRGEPGHAPNIFVPLGDYVVTLEVGGERLSQIAHITKTQGWTVGNASPEKIR